MRLPHPGYMNVDPALGHLTYVVQDISIPCRGGMRLYVSRHYDSRTEHKVNTLGGNWSGWCFNFDEHLRFEYRARTDLFAPLPGMDYALYPPSPLTSTEVKLQAVSIILPDRRVVRYVVQNGAFVAVDAWNHSGLVRNEDGTFTVTTAGYGASDYRADGRLKAIRDTLGNQISYEWSPAPEDRLFLTAIVDPVGRVLNVSYEISGSTVTATAVDWSGRAWRYVYALTNNGARLVAFIDADGHATRYTYGQNGIFAGLWKVDFPNGTFVTNEAAGFRPLGRRVGRQVFGDRLTAVHQYDLSNRTTTRTLLGGSQPDVTVYEFDKNYNNTDITDAAGNRYQYAFDSQNRPEQSINPRLGTRKVEYDADWRIVSRTNPLGDATTTEYHPVFRHLPVRVTKPGPTPRTTTYTYDPQTAQLLTVTDSADGVTRLEYDSMGNVEAVTAPGGGRYTMTTDDVMGTVLTMTDPENHVTRFSYDQVGHLLSFTTPQGETTRYTWSPGGLITSVTDSDGVHQYEYDGNRNLVQETDAQGNVTRYEFNVLNELTRTIDPLGRITETSYTAKGEVAAVSRPGNQTTAMEYDVLGRVVKTTDPAGQVTESVYDSSCGEANSTDPLGRTAHTVRDLLCRPTLMTRPDGAQLETIYNADGSIQSTTDAMGNVTSYVTDVMGRTVQTTDALGRVTKTSYDAAGNTASTTDARGAVTRHEYDSNNRRVRTIFADGSQVSNSYDGNGNVVARTDGRGKIWTMAYDSKGRQVATTDPLGRTSRTVYDSLGRVLQAITPTGRIMSTQYDAIGRVTSTSDPMGNVTTRVYDDASGNLLATVDALGRATHMEYDNLNRVVKVVDSRGGITSVTYDAAGRKTMIEDANGHNTSYEYDLMDRVTAEIYADGSRTTYTWDANGNMLSKRDQRGLLTQFEYDAVNQLTRVTMPDQATVTLSYDLNGNIVERVDGSGVYQFVYDVMNRPTRIVQNGKAFELSYDADGRQLTLVHPDGRTATMAYDDAGRLASVLTPDRGETSFAYDDENRRVGIVYPNGTSALSEYDQNSRLVRLVHQDSSGAAITQDFRMANDAVGNMLAQHDGTTPMWTYGYDALDRLTSARDEQAAQTTSWIYDAVGNRMTETAAGVTTTFAYNALNQLVRFGDTTLFWDSNGNLAQKVSPAGVTRYYFDSRDRLVEIGLPNAQVIRYGYDQHGRMITRADASGTTTFEWNGWDLEREISPSGVVTRYFYNGSEMIGFQRDEEHYRVHSDWLSSVRTVTDRFGNTVASFEYGPWGEQTAVSDAVPGGFAYRWVGGYGVRWDEGAGLYYMRNRFYEPVLQRFVSRDPIRKGNLYAYTSNAPTNLVDPMGLEPPKVFTKDYLVPNEVQETRSDIQKSFQSNGVFSLRLTYNWGAGQRTTGQIVFTAIVFPANSTNMTDEGVVTAALHVTDPNNSTDVALEGYIAARNNVTNVQTVSSTSNFPSSIAYRQPTTLTSTFKLACINGRLPNSGWYELKTTTPSNGAFLYDRVNFSLPADPNP